MNTDLDIVAKCCKNCIFAKDTGEHEGFVKCYRLRKFILMGQMGCKYFAPNR